MARGAEGNRDSAMAAYLKKSGYPHGRRFSTTNAPCVPSMQDVGSAAYRRRVAKIIERGGAS